MRRTPEQKAVRRASRLIEDARFLVRHQYLGTAILVAYKAIFELESALYDGPLRIPSPSTRTPNA